VRELNIHRLILCHRETGFDEALKGSIPIAAAAGIIIHTLEPPSTRGRLNNVRLGWKGETSRRVGFRQNDLVEFSYYRWLQKAAATAGAEKEKQSSGAVTPYRGV
jgi:hypothetical protein